MKKVVRISKISRVEEELLIVCIVISNFVFLFWICFLLFVFVYFLVEKENEVKMICYR